MRIGVISDTHGSVYAMKGVVQAAGAVDAWIHLGDHHSDAGFLRVPGAEVFAVRGNCDAPFGAPDEAVIELGGKRLFIAHGHTYQVKNTRTRLVHRARELNCEAALYGHTHCPAYEASGGLLLLNPGSPSLSRGGSERTFAVLTVDKGVISGRILTV